MNIQSSVAGKYATATNRQQVSKIIQGDMKYAKTMSVAADDMLGRLTTVVMDAKKKQNG